MAPYLLLSRSLQREGRRRGQDSLRQAALRGAEVRAGPCSSLPRLALGPGGCGWVRPQLPGRDGEAEAAAVAAAAKASLWAPRFPPTPPAPAPCAAACRVSTSGRPRAQQLPWGKASMDRPPPLWSDAFRSPAMGPQLPAILVEAGLAVTPWRPGARSKDHAVEQPLFATASKVTRDPGRRWWGCPQWGGSPDYRAPAAGRAPSWLPGDCTVALL